MKPLADGRAVILFNRGTEAGAPVGRVGGDRPFPGRSARGARPVGEKGPRGVHGKVRDQGRPHDVAMLKITAKF